MNTDTTTRAVVSALLGAGLLDPDRRHEADQVVRTAITTENAHPPGASAPMRRRMAEIAGYIGGAFVVGAAVLFFAGTWADLGLGQQAALLYGAAVVLVAAAAGFTIGAGGRSALRAPSEAVRRRLTSVLATGAAGSVAFGTGLLLGDAIANEELAVMLAALTALVVSLLGYVVAPTTVGQLGIAVPAFVMIPSGLSSLHTDSTSTIPFGLLVLALGAGWLVLAERSVWQERLSARVVGSVLAVVGAQVPVSDNASWVGYLATAAVGAAAFGLYVGTRAWPYLATGVVAVTLAVPEAVNDWAGGSLGAAGILLATGVTLLVAALLGLRLRQEVQESDVVVPH